MAIFYATSSRCRCHNNGLKAIKKKMYHSKHTVFRQLERRKKVGENTNLTDDEEQERYEYLGRHIMNNAFCKFLMTIVCFAVAALAAPLSSMQWVS